MKNFLLIQVLYTHERGGELIMQSPRFQERVRVALDHDFPCDNGASQYMAQAKQCLEDRGHKVIGQTEYSNSKFGILCEAVDGVFSHLEDRF